MQTKEISHIWKDHHLKFYQYIPYVQIFHDKLLPKSVLGHHGKNLHFYQEQIS